MKLVEWKKEQIKKNGKYGVRVNHPVNGQLVYPEQVRAGKTTKDRK